MLSQRQTRQVRALHRRKGRRASHECLVEGPRVIGELLHAGRPMTLVLYTEEATAEPAGRGLLDELNAAGFEVARVTDRELRRLAGTVTPQGWLAVVPMPAWEWSDLDRARLLVLDAVSDPGNVGTLIRSAEALGAGGVVALPGTADPWNLKVVRAAAGSSFRMPVVEVEREEALARLSEEDTSVWAAASDGQALSRGERGPRRLALVLGNEGAGVSAEVRGAAERIVAIPMNGEVESLNAALAGAILLDRLFGG